MARPLVMGVLNVTPDSFSDGGRYDSVTSATRRALEMVDEGADVIDVGGESTRPGATPVSLDEETARVLPVVEAVAAALAGSGTRISIDTRHAAVAHAAVAAGATIINDISASLHEVAAEMGVGWVAVHMSGVPESMQAAPHYDDVVTEVRDHLVERAARARAAGVGELWIDPGIGFGKSATHNLELLAHLDELVRTGLPVLIGTSRKSTLGMLTRASDARVGIESTAGPDDRFEASVATATWAMHQGVAMVRAHDVRAHVHAAAVVAGSIPTTIPDAA